MEVDLNNHTTLNVLAHFRLKFPIVVNDSKRFTTTINQLILHILFAQFLGTMRVHLSPVLLERSVAKYCTVYFCDKYEFPAVGTSNYKLF